MENTIILNSGEKIEVLLSDEVSLDIECSLRYIQSGKKEIETYVSDTAKPRLDEVIRQAQSEMSMQIAEGVEEAKAAAETEARTTIASSIVTAEQQISNYVSQNITPDITAAVNAAENAKTAAAGSAATATTAAALAETLKTGAETAKNEAETAASLAVQKAEEAGNVTEKVIPPLLSFQFTDHILNNASWLRADSFSWASAAVYVSAYEHLVADIANITAETETIGGYTVTFYRAADGHKICLADQETIVNNIFTTTGAAWYYILDTENERFKLPRGLHGTVVQSYQNGENWYRIYSDGWCEQGGHTTTSSVTLLKEYNDTSYNITMSQAGGSAYTAQPRNKTTSGFSYYNYQTSYDAYWRAYGYISGDFNNMEKYLYFYVGETVQDANLINAGAVLDSLANKVDSDSPHVVETYVNGTSWYRVYSDGWCEQGGFVSGYADSDVTVTYLKAFVNTNYTLLVIPESTATQGFAQIRHVGAISKTNTSFMTRVNSALNLNKSWQACGYIS